MSEETQCRIVEEPLDRLAEYGTIPIRFEVRSIFEVMGDDPATAELREPPVSTPWVKDYDTMKGEGPTRWAKHWDVSNWGLLSAYIGVQRVGGCVIAHNTAGVNKLEGRNDLAALWDLRIPPDYRRQGIGQKLFAASVHWAQQRNCRELKIETQNINVSACRFYQQQGSSLCSIDRTCYNDLPDEVELIWCLNLWSAQSELFFNQRVLLITRKH